MTECRKACHYILVNPEDCISPHGLDLSPGSRDSSKVEMLTEAFARDGFDMDEPALVGYPCDGKIQLLSGTHRHEAARRSGIQLPVTMHLRSIVEAAWRTSDWDKLILDVPVSELQLMPVPNPQPPPGLDERVNINELYQNKT